MVLVRCRPLNLDAIRADARATRQAITERTVLGSATELEALGAHMYPRSFGYDIDATGHLVNRFGSGTILRMYGSDARGRTVAASIVGFTPHFYVDVGDASDTAVAAWLESLNDALTVLASLYECASTRRGVRPAVLGGARPITRHEFTTAVPVRVSGPRAGFNNGTTSRFVCVHVYAPSLVTLARDLLEYVHEHRARALPSRGDVVRLLLEASAAYGRDASPPAAIAAAQAAAAATAAAQARRQSHLISEYAENPWLDPLVDVPDVFDEAASVLPAGLVLPESLPRVAHSALHRWSMRRGPATSVQRSLALLADTAVDVFESNVDYVIRFLIDTRLAPEECVCFAADSRFERRTRATAPNAINDIEYVHVPVASVSRCPNERLVNAVPPQAVLSFDCEMATGHGFPRPERDAVLQTCVYVGDVITDALAAHGARRAFVLGDVELPEPGDVRYSMTFAPTDIYAYAREADALVAVATFIGAFAPDALTGYNIADFDIPYLLARARLLGVADAVAALTRAPHGGEVRTHASVFSSKAHGTHKSTEVVGEGLYVYDVLPALQRSTRIKARSYRLEAMVTRFLGKHKDAVSYDMISELQKTPDGRFMLLHYCTWDAVLPALLIGKLKLHLNNMAMARLTGATIDMVNRRGIQIRLRAHLYREAAYDEPRRLMATRTGASRWLVTNSYEGADVYDPVPGLYTVPIATLDFQALYPSLIKEHNICFTTMLPAATRTARIALYGLDRERDVFDDVPEALAGVPRERQPAFVRASHTLGLVPRVCERLLARRAEVKVAMKAEKRPFERGLLDSNQLALKELVNSLYGMLGAVHANEYHEDLASAVTALGRIAIRETRDVVNRYYTPANGFSFTASILYGDTDSVFVRFVAEPGTVLTLEEAAHWAKHMAARVNEYFGRRYGSGAACELVIVFEKIFKKLIMYRKKRYVGVKFEFVKNEDGVEVLVCTDEQAASGMETERRDGCLLVSNGVGTVVGMMLADTADTVAQTRARVAEYIVYELIDRFASGNVPWSELIQSKQFRKSLEEYMADGKRAAMHAELAARLAARFAATGKGVTYREGARIVFVVTEPTRKDQAAADLAEDPDYAWTSGVRLSTRHYVENAIKKTMARVLVPILPSATRQRTFGSASASASTVTEKELIGRLDALLRTVPPRATVSAHTPRRGGVLAFASARRARCGLCGTPVDVPGARVCSGHSPADRAAYARANDERTLALVAERDSTARVCRACKQGWSATDEPERAATTLEGAPADAAIERTLGCNVNTCDVYWRRRLVDRRAHVTGLVAMQPGAASVEKQ